eukprot:PhM_4_TR13570/c0_g1_i1/m.80297
MRITIKWFMSGNHDTFEDTDAIINPNTTMLEIKGFIQMRYMYPAKEIGLIYKHLLDNPVRLRDIGIVDQATADATVITAHLFRDEDTDLEPSNLGDEASQPIEEFTHEDFALAMAILGKDVPVMPERLKEMRESAPKERPAFLNKAPAAAPPTSTATAGAPRSSDLVARLQDIYRNFRYGPRAEGVEKELALQYPGVEEPYEYWDMRLPESAVQNITGNDIALEMFFFGEFKLLDSKKFPVLVQQFLGAKFGYRCLVPVPAREAGCMYPLVAVVIVMDAADAQTLSEKLFVDFGKEQTKHKAAGGSGGVQTGKGQGCAQQ